MHVKFIERPLVTDIRRMGIYVHWNSNVDDFLALDDSNGDEKYSAQKSIWEIESQLHVCQSECEC